MNVQEANSELNWHKNEGTGHMSNQKTNHADSTYAVYSTTHSKSTKLFKGYDGTLSMSCCVAL